jgi:hypothetical protein
LSSCLLPALTETHQFAAIHRHIRFTFSVNSSIQYEHFLTGNQFFTMNLYPTHPRRRLRLSLLALFALLALPLILAGCASPKFASDWRHALKTPPTGIEGAWEGTWLSENTGHQGKLRCLVSSQPHMPHTFNFQYWASWATVLSGSFEVSYFVKPDGDTYSVTGESDLGPFGVFSHQGHISKDHFQATFRSGEDQGVFEMTRPH